MRTALCCLALLLAAGCGDDKAAPDAPAPDITTAPPVQPERLTLMTAESVPVVGVRDPFF
jgi:hypothetical protein